MSKSGTIAFILGFAAVCAAVYLVSRCIGTGDEARFEKTVAMTISRREKIARLATVRYHEDLILYDRDSKGDTVAVLVAHPEVILGVDLRALAEEDFRRAGDTIFVNLPHAVVLHSICNPSQREIIYSAKEWNLDSRMKLLVSRARRMAEADARREGAMKRAEDNAAAIMARLVSTGDDCKVVVSFTDGSATDRGYSLPQSDGVH